MSAMFLNIKEIVVGQIGDKNNCYLEFALNQKNLKLKKIAMIDVFIVKAQKIIVQNVVNQN